MDSLTQGLPRPRTLTRTAALLAPLAWCAAIGLMSSLIDGTCVMGSHVMLWVCSITCIALAGAPAVFLGRRRRSLDVNTHSASSTYLILDLAVAGSVVLALVMMATAVPILFQNTCSA